MIQPERQPEEIPGNPRLFCDGAEGVQRDLKTASSGLLPVSLHLARGMVAESRDCRSGEPSKQNDSGQAESGAISARSERLFFRSFPST
jgi:hypothetical protein